MIKSKALRTGAAVCVSMFAIGALMRAACGDAIHLTVLNRSSDPVQVLWRFRLANGKAPYEIGWSSSSVIASGEKIPLEIFTHFGRKHLTYEVAVRKLGKDEIGMAQARAGGTIDDADVKPDHVIGFDYETFIDLENGHPLMVVGEDAVIQFTRDGQPTRIQS